MTREDEALARVLLAGKHLDDAALERAKKLQREKHAALDLASVLLRYKILDKTKLALALKLARMAPARTASDPGPTPAGGTPGSGPVAPTRAAGHATPPPSGPPTPAPLKPANATSEADTRPLGAVGGPAPGLADTSTAKTAIGQDPERLDKSTPASGSDKESGARWKRAHDRTRFGQYEVVEKIAKGGMGIVFKVRHPGLDRHFALKVLAQGEDASEEVLERFRREAKTAARLDHPAIVRVHDAGTEDGFPFIVMDLVTGDSLAKLVKDEGVTPRKAALIARSVAAALGHAHQAGIIHRDVKPDNVLIDRATGEAKLSDFGIVKDLHGGESEARLTRTGLTLGSPCYMSPEQASGRHKDVGPCSDVYSLGATLYEALAGRPPFEGDSIHDIMVKVVNEEPVPPRRLNPAVTPELEAICLKALEKEPGRRYPTAKAFEDDLDRYVDGRPVEARPAGAVAKTLRAMRRHRTTAGLVSLLVLVVAWAAGDAVVKGSRERRERAQRLETQLASAEASLELASRPETPEFDTRRAYREAIRTFDRVLEENPLHPRAREGKRKAVLGLADRLLERREPGFAEFVLDQAEGLADPAEIGSRLELARHSEWVAKAEAAELAGDLEEALRLNKEGLRALKQAGLEGSQLDEKVKELERDLARRKRDEEVRQLVDTADRHAANGELTAALETLGQALAVDKDAVGLHERITITESRLRRQAEDAVEQALADRERAHAAQPDGFMRPELVSVLDKAEALLRGAREKLGHGEPGAALDAARSAQANFRGAYDIASSLAAREDARSARAATEKSDASKYATAELASAQEEWESGEALLASADFVKARGHFVQAAKLYRLAAAAGATKQTVSAAKDLDRSARSSALAEVPTAITLRSVREAQALEQDAQKAEDAGDTGKARELWTKAAEQWGLARDAARPASSALAARDRALKQKTEAETEQGGEFDADDMQLGQRSSDDGDQALAHEDFQKAATAYGLAEYRWRQATLKSSPISRPKRHTEQLRKVAEDARDRAAAAGKVDTKRYEEGARYFAMGEDAEKRRYWRGAEEYYTHARSLFESLVPSDK